MKKGRPKKREQDIPKLKIQEENYFTKLHLLSSHKDNKVAHFLSSSEPDFVLLTEQISTIKDLKATHLLQVLPENNN